MNCRSRLSEKSCAGSFVTDVLRVASLVLLGLVSSCDPSGHDQAHGHLYFAAGNYVGQFDLSDGSSLPAANLGDVTIDHLSNLPGGNLLLTLRVFMNGRETSRILRFNLRQGVSFALFPGFMAEFLPGPKAVIYSDGSRLLATRREHSYHDEFVIDDHGYNSRPTVIMLSESELLFDRVNDGNVVIHRYNADDDTSQALQQLSGVCDLNGAVWIGDTDQLLCRRLGTSPQDSSYVLVSLDGTIEKTLPLPDDKILRALVYLPDQRLVVLTERSNSWGGGQPRNAVWIYDMLTAESYVIAKDQYLGVSVVYRP
jgi:hypothetical protein